MLCRLGITYANLGEDDNAVEVSKNRSIAMEFVFDIIYRETYRIVYREKYSLCKATRNYAYLTFNVII